MVDLVQSSTLTEIHLHGPRARKRDVDIDIDTHLL